MRLVCVGRELWYFRAPPPPRPADAVMESERALDSAMAALRSEGLARSLVVTCTGLSPSDVPPDNFNEALRYVKHNLKHHRFADMGHSGFAVRELYEELISKLERNSAHKKAHALRALCSALTTSTSNGSWEWQAARHPGVSAERGNAVLVALYYLSDNAKMDRTPTFAPQSLRALSRPSLSAADSTGEEAFEQVQWGYSDAEDETGEEEAAAEETAREANDLSHDGEGPASGFSSEATGAGATVVDSPTSVTPGRAYASPRSSQFRLGRPPARLRLDLLLGGTAAEDGASADGPYLQSATPAIDLDADPRRSQLSQLRLVREYLRATSGVGGREWDVVPPSSGPGRSVRLSRGAGREQLLAQPTAAARVIDRLERLASHAVNLRGFAQTLVAHPAAPAVLQAFADALLLELQPLNAYVWDCDADARAAQQATAAGARAAPQGATQPTLLALAHRLRCSEGSGGGGWARKLSALERLRRQLCTADSIDGLVQGRPMARDGAALAATHAIDSLVAACEAEQLMGGDHAERHTAGGDGEDSGSDEAAGAPAVAPGAMTLLPMFLRLLVAAWMPYLRGIQAWICDGRLTDPSDELPVLADQSVTLSEAAEHWMHAFTLRDESAIPTRLRALAPQILLAGKSRHLLHRMHASHGGGARRAHSPPRPTDHGTTIDEAGALLARQEPPPLDAAVSDALTRALRSALSPPMAPASQEARAAASDLIEAVAAAPIPAMGRDPQLTLSRRTLLPRPPPTAMARPALAPPGGGGDEDDQAAIDEPPPYSMARCAPLTTPPCAVRDRSAVSRLAGARRGLCYLPVALAVDDDENGSDAAVDALRGALGYAAEGGVPGLIDGSEAAHVARSVLALPPLAQVIDGCLLAPIRARCSAAGPLLLSAIASQASPVAAAALLHRVLLFAEPRLTAPLFERLFASLTDEHRAWRRRLPEFHTHLLEGLVGGGVPGGIARCFALEIDPRRRRATAHGAGDGAAAAAAQADAPTLDAADARALSELRLRFSARWPLQLAVSDACLATHEEVSGLLLQLRRAKWALETTGGTAAALRLGGGDGEAAWCAHPWRVLRAEVLHLVGAIYTHFTLGVIGPEWRSFRDEAVPRARDVDAFRAAHEAFAARVHRRCLLAAADAPIHRAIEAILGLALRLRMQLEALPRVGARAHAESAARWREELQGAVRFVLDELRSAARREPRGELLDLCRLLDFNGYYRGGAMLS